MAKPSKKIAKRLADKLAGYNALKNTKGYTKPGSGK
jgi:hypothetical protein